MSRASRYQSYQDDDDNDENNTATLNPFLSMKPKQSLSGQNQPEKPCRACTDFKSWIKMNKKAGDGNQPSDFGQTATASESSKECPLDIEELGRNTWSFLHTMAAYYPETPSLKDQGDMVSFIKLFSKFYPCSHCAGDFRESIKEVKPDVSSRYSLSQWFCEQHNIVNDKLGKPAFDCSKVLERWGVGWKDGSCDE